MLAEEVGKNMTSSRRYWDFIVIISHCWIKAGVKKPESAKLRTMWNEMSIQGAFGGGGGGVCEVLWPIKSEDTTRQK